MFHDVRLPDTVERGAQGGPRFNTTVLELSSGYEKRNAAWSKTRGEWDIGYGIARFTDLEEVIAFFYARMGRLYGFRFKDWADHTVDLGVQLVAVGGETTMQLVKRYVSGAYYFERAIYKPVAGSVTIRKNGSTMGSGWSVNNDTGLVTFTAPLVAADQITASFEFDVPVRFADDSLDVNVDIFNAGQIPNIKLIEIKQLDE